MHWGWLAGLAAATMTAPAGAASLESYGRLPSATNIEISPDGSRIAVVNANAEGQVIRIVKADDLSFVAGFRAGDIKIIGLQWIGSDHLLIIYSKSALPTGLVGQRGEFWLVLDFNLKTGKGTNLLDLGNILQPANFISAWPQPAIIDGKPIVVLSAPFAGMLRDNLDTGRTSTIEFTRVVPDHYNSIFTATGEPVAQLAYNEFNGAWSLWTHTTGDWKRLLYENHPIDAPEADGLTEKGDALIIERAEDGVSHFSALPLAGGPEVPIATMDGGSPLFDPVGRSVIGAELETSSGVRYAFFDPDRQKLWDAIARAFPGELVRLASWSQDWSKVILRVEGTKSGAAYFLLDTRTRQASWIADRYEGVTADQIAQVQAIQYAAADGLDIPAYLTLPHGLPAKNLPLVVLVHGGPRAHDSPGFDWWAQALASLGYAVLQPQFRGSDDVSTGFVAAGYGQWGRKMQSDLSDGVRFLATRGTIDPSRVCIAGASYGGYAAMAGVTMQAGIYRCAVSVAGISDLHRQMTSTSTATLSGNDSGRRYWLRFFGAQNSGDPIIDEMSPIRHLDKLTVPLLLIHGSIDTIVQPSQSKAMLEAATKAGKQVSLVTLDGEDHNLARGATRLQMLQAMAEFLKKNLPVTEMHVDASSPNSARH